MSNHSIQVLDTYAIADQSKIAYLQRIVDLLDQPEATTANYRYTTAFELKHEECADSFLSADPRPATASTQPITDADQLLEAVWTELSTSIVDGTTTYHTTTGVTTASQATLFAIAASIGRMGSDLLERVIRFSSLPQLVNFLRATIGTRWVHLVMHGHASHVFDTTLTTVVSLDEGNQYAQAREMVGELMNWFIKNGVWDQLTTSRYACPCLKHLLEVADQIKLDDKLRAKFRHHITQSSDLQKVIGTPFGSSLVQHILLDEVGDLTATVAAANSRNKQAAQPITTAIPANLATPCFDSVFNLLTANQGFFTKAMKDQAMSRLIEVILSIVSRKVRPANAPEAAHNLTSIYAEHFRHNLLKLCSHPVANFVVQKLIETAASSLPLLKLILTELQDHIFELLHGKSGVVMKLMQQAAKHEEVQKDLIKALIKALAQLNAEEKVTEAPSVKPTEPAVPSSAETNQTRREVATLLLHLKNSSTQVFKKSKYSDQPDQRPIRQAFSPIGAGILSALFDFQPDLVKFVVSSFATLDVTAELLPLSRDPASSFVVERFLTGKAIDVKNKQLLLDSFLGNYGNLASHNISSHVVDKAFSIADVSRKEKIAAEIAAVEKELSAKPHGRFVLRNCKISSYKGKKDTWRQTEESHEKKRQMFAEFTKEDGPAKPAAAAATSTANNAAKAATVEPKVEEKSEKKVKKRKREDKDEIDALFAGRDSDEPPKKRSKKDKEHKKDKKKRDSTEVKVKDEPEEPKADSEVMEVEPKMEDKEHKKHKKHKKEKHKSKFSMI